jgi:hypothetical protein
MKNKLLKAALAATAITAGVIYYKKKRKARRTASAEPGTTARPDNGAAERGRTFNTTPSTSF